MNPDMQLLIMAFIVAALFVFALFHQISKGEKKAAVANRKVAEDAVKGLIDDIKSPSRHRWVNTTQGEVIQFIYLLLGRNSTRSETGHLVWAEVTLFRNRVEVNVFHTVDISSSDDYLVGTVDTLRRQGWTVRIFQTDEQPNLDHTGVRSSEVVT